MAGGLLGAVFGEILSPSKKSLPSELRPLLHGEAVMARSVQQSAAYASKLDELVAILSVGTPMTVEEIRAALATEGGMPAAATVLARIEALKACGVAVKKMKRREKIPGKSGPRERAYSVVL